ncbi:MAG: acyltransferase [Sphingomonas bacterium]|uniref:acyltransferase family protein n=1 Tax=Sphingomonas bacterium TaxID=1895847 RepID=UPI00262B0F4A|nr:acyltransferase [Sphingomonas bacterium]MDB5709390.1 acyltransferase [Sphingomonas bacterium]
MQQSSIDTSATAAPFTAGFEHKRHFTDLDGLRGLLALSVVFLHYGGNLLMLRATRGVVPGFEFQLSVDFFFLLSGFVLTHAMRGGVPDATGFAIKRAFRLLPLYYLGFAAMLVLSLIATRPAPFIHFHVTPRMILSDIALITPALRHDPLDAPAWSVTWELFLPILAVILANRVRLPVRRFAPALLVLLLVCMSYTSWIVAIDGWAYAARAFLGLAAGMCLRHCADHWRVPPALRRPAVFHVLIALLLAIMMAARIVPIAAALFPWFAAAAIVAGTGTRGLLSRRPFAWLGAISYSLYLVHVPVLAAIFMLGGVDRGSPLVKLGALVAALALATLLTVLVERPAMRAGRRLRAR